MPDSSFCTLKSTILRLGNAAFRPFLKTLSEPHPPPASLGTFLLGQITALP